MPHLYILYGDIMPCTTLEIIEKPPAEIEEDTTSIVLLGVVFVLIIMFMM